MGAEARLSKPTKDKILKVAEAKSSARRDEWEKVSIQFRDIASSRGFNIPLSWLLEFQPKKDRDSYIDAEYVLVKR